MSAGPKVQSTILRGEGGALVRLVGTIEADFQPEELATLQGTLVLDLDGVKRITSFGVREWIRFLKSCVAESVVFVNARPGMVAQFNLVGGFAGHGVLASCYLPYICEECDTETEVLLDLTTSHDVITRKEPPPLSCPKCNAATEFDDIPASYFSWMASQPAPALSDVARRVISGEAAPVAASGTLQVKKEVADAVTGLWLTGRLDKGARFKRAVDGLEGFVVVVCAGISDVDEEGAGKLVDLVGTTEAMITLARVSVLLLRAIPRDRREVLMGRVSSLSWKTGCKTCGRKTTAETTAPLVMDDAGVVAARCTVCGTSGAITLTAQQQLIARYFLAPAVPIEITSYLLDRPGIAPPEAEPITSTNRAEPAAPSRYRVIRPLGAGGMAEVFLAEQQGPEGFLKKVVLKRILPNLSSDEEFIRMFLQEARTAARINHPNVVQIFDLGKEGKRYFMAMEYVRGWDLREVMKAVSRSGRRMPVEIACRIAADICSGLHAAHTCVDDNHKTGIIHRDVSPHNVLLSDEGAVKITDFGISKVGDSSIGTRPGVVKGKIFYMAPEQLEPAMGTVDAASDVFAAGLVLREMLTGMALFRRDNDYAAMRAVLSDPIPALVEVRPDVGRRLSDIVGRAVERDRRVRYPTAQALRLDLENELVASGRACTSAHLAQWLQSLVNGTVGTSHAVGPDFHPPPSVDGSVDDVFASHGFPVEDVTFDEGRLPQVGDMTMRVDVPTAVKPRGSP